MKIFGCLRKIIYISHIKYSKKGVKDVRKYFSGVNCSICDQSIEKCGAYLTASVH